MAVSVLLSLALALPGCGGSAVRTDPGGGAGVDPGGGAGVDPGAGSIAWLLPGTRASEQDRAEAIAAIEARNAAAAHMATVVGSAKALGRIAALPVSGGVYRSVEGSIDTWGAWSHPALSGDIAKVQRVNEYYGTRALEVGRQVVGLMDHGYFGIGHATKRFHEGMVSTEGRSRVSAFHAFHAADDSISGAMPLRSLDLAGARWTGDALGVERASEAAVFGPASLEITGGPVNAGTPQGGGLVRPPEHDLEQWRRRSARRRRGRRRRGRLLRRRRARAGRRDGGFRRHVRWGERRGGAGHLRDARLCRLLRREARAMTGALLRPVTARISGDGDDGGADDRLGVRLTARW